jgi:hypothetical protein
LVFYTNLNYGPEIPPTAVGAIEFRRGLIERILNYPPTAVGGI